MTAVLQPVRFQGDGGLCLVGDEWNSSGPDDGSPTILMLHGGGQNRFSWKNTGQILANRGLHVIALDARGHGDSDRAPNSDYTLHALARDIAAVLAQIDRPVVIVGASMGGMTGMLTAAQAGPHQVTGLVLVDVVPRFQNEGTARIREFMTRHVHGFETLEHAADAIAEYLPYRKRQRNLDGLKKNLHQREGRWHWHWDPAFVTAIRDEPFADVDELERAVGQLDIPILLIRGRLSDVVSPEGVADFLSKVPHAQFVELSDAGHTAAGDDNDAFTDAVVGFITR
ncbi:alpha/beta hydrolase [Mycolicibacterium sp.]|uniref:alpha/beta fold hydrolase n=1 Tax=Mycolicibacterium sp. TaxID=2320850 RepID=UPI0028A9AAB4|nr:alpha/beta hydrolase [Mycolicibacterium sp.]